MSDLNDPRVFFAAERTLLAWSRTSLTLMAFGFVVERFGLFMSLFSPEQGAHPEQGVSFWVGIAFILLGAYVSAAATVQYRRILKRLKPTEIPEGYRVNTGVLTNLFVAILGIALLLYLFVAQ